MPEFTVSEYDKHPEGEFPAQLVAWEESEGQWGTQVKWFFETNQEGPRLGYFTSTKIHPMSKLGMMLEALGVPLPRNQFEATTFDADSLIGKCCRVRVEHRGQFANIVEFLPLVRGNQEPAPVAAGATQAPVEVPDNYDPFA